MPKYTTMKTKLRSNRRPKLLTETQLKPKKLMMVKNHSKKEARRLLIRRRTKIKQKQGLQRDRKRKKLRRVAWTMRRR